MDSLVSAARAWSHNPFHAGRHDRVAQRARLLEPQVAEHAVKVARQANVSAIREMVMGVACAQATEGDARRVVPERAWAPVLKAAGWQRSQVVRMAMAAARCTRGLTELAGESSSVRAVREQVWAACFGTSLVDAVVLERVIRDHDVLIMGETGTGKELLAQAVLAGTPGNEDGEPAPSAMINAAALPETLVEGELFGHARGAFTGATTARRGRIRSADGGAFFLDEVGDLPQATQAKLLRVIEQDEVMSLGSDTQHHVDVRFVAATHRDLPAMIERGTFRRDLHERLAGVCIHVPALRERPDDILPIGLVFLRQHAPAGAEEQARRVEAWLRSGEPQRAPWPGNVRGLFNALRNLLLGLPAEGSPRAASARTSRAEPVPGVPPRVLAGAATLSQATDWYLRHVLATCGGNQVRAARVLEVDRATLRRRVGGARAQAVGPMEP